MGGGVVNSLLFYFTFHFSVVLYITRKSDSVANSKVVHYLHLKCIRNFAPDSWHKVFLRGWKSEVVISRMVCGVCIILIVVENDRKKNNFSALATPGLH